MPFAASDACHASRTLASTRSPPCSCSASRAGSGSHRHARRWIRALVFIIALVFQLRAFNTALESLADASVPVRHPLVGAAKDLAAGGVLVAALAAAVVGALVLGPHLWEACQRFR